MSRSRGRLDARPDSAFDESARLASRRLSRPWVAVKAAIRRAADEVLGAQTRNEILKKLQALEKMLECSTTLSKEQFIADLLGTEPYVDPARLEQHGFKVYSQHEEDGIVQEIFRRIGATNKIFVEFGVENGLENNTLKLLLEGWRGLWIDANKLYVTSIQNRFSDLIEAQQLTVKSAFITVDNVNGLIEAWTTGEIDLLSVDIDGNDYYVWQALSAIKPRVVIIEYNAKFRPPLSIAQEYRADHVWRGTDYFGASLEALARLGTSLGYALVGTNIVGSNAFFVRSELVEDRFQAPFSATNHYNPARYFLSKFYVSGHAPDWGRYMHVPMKSAPSSESHR